MTTKAYIVGHKAGSPAYTVRIPLFETAGSVPGKGTYLNSSLFEATLSYQPGNLNSYAVGDCVFVVFEDSRMAKPVIVGRLYSGSEGKATDAVNASSLSVADKAVLPGDTTVGGVTVSKLIQNCDSLNGLLTGKVDKIAGSSLMTDAEHTKLGTIANTYVTKSSLNTINGASMQTGSDISISGTMTSGSIAIDTTTNSDFCKFAYNHPNAIWSYSTATSTPPNVTYHNYPALIYAEEVWVSVTEAYTYKARVFYFDPDTKAYTEITSGTLNYSIAS